MTAATRRRVMIVDDDASLAETLAERLPAFGYEAFAVDGGRSALGALGREAWDALVTDLRMPGTSGLDLVRDARSLAPTKPVIVMTAFSAVDSAIESIRLGAFHYLTKPFRVEELCLFLDRAFEVRDLAADRDALARELARDRSFQGLVATSPALREVIDVLVRVADTSVPILLTGETGTGKSAIARAIHAESGRAGRFVVVNAAALPDNLLESELFGHVRGAFTGASEHREGLFSEARGGTLFLDEVGDLPLALQAKLLDALERGVVRPVGANREVEVNVRVIAATNRGLRKAVAEGAFREDLFYRLDVVSVDVPPLRRRRDDVPGLAARFLATTRAAHPRVEAERFSPSALRALVDAPWPGNVRELAHAVTRAALLARGPTIEVADLPAVFASPGPAPEATFSGEVVPLRRVQRAYAEWALERLGGKKTLACTKLGVDPKTLRKLLGEGDDPDAAD